MEKLYNASKIYASCQKLNLDKETTEALLHIIEAHALITAQVLKNATDKMEVRHQIEILEAKNSLMKGIIGTGIAVIVAVIGGFVVNHLVNEKAQSPTNLQSPAYPPTSNIAPTQFPAVPR